MSTAAVPGDMADDHGHEDHHELGFLRSYIFSEDHKIIGIQFLFSGLIFFVVGGLLAMAVRWQLAFPWKEMPLFGKILSPSTAGIVPPETYNMFFTMHASVMIFFVIIPLLTGTFGNFCIPLMIGARDMAFPKLNMLSYWFMVPAAITIVLSFFVEGGAAGAGWTSYPPLSTIIAAAPNSMNGQTLWLISLLFIGVSSMMGSINYLTTIINMRAPGMTFFRMPMTVWSLFITALLQAFALPVLTAALIMQLLDRVLDTSFFLPANLMVNGASAGIGGGQPLLWQHLFWFYSHPAVYIMILPAMGIVSDVISTFSRKPLFGYKPMVFSIGGIAGLGFIVWAHHMFVSGLNPTLAMAFMVSTMMIALPSAIKIFNWLATLWQGNIQITTAMLNAIAFVSMFVIGGLSGIFMAATPVDGYFHDTYFIVGHIHYVLFGGSVFAIFAGIHYWFPKMFGRELNDGLGKVHFVLTFLSYNATFFTMHIMGIAGMRRRIADYETLQELVGMNKFMTMAAFVLGVVQIIFAVNFIYSLFWGPKTSKNPWNSNTLEWEAPSPPGHGNFGASLPTVYRGPYEYASPECEEDFLPQAKDTSAEASS